MFFLATFAFANFEATLALLDQGGRSDFERPTRTSSSSPTSGFVLMFVQGGVYRPLAKRFERSEPSCRVGIVPDGRWARRPGRAWRSAPTRRPVAPGPLADAFLVALAVAVVGLRVREPVGVGADLAAAPTPIGRARCWA